jgi:hypothetical protein
MTTRYQIFRSQIISILVYVHSDSPGRCDGLKCDARTSVSSLEDCQNFPGRIAKFELSVIPGKWSMCGQPYESNGNPADQQIPVDNRIISVISRQAARWIAVPPVVLILSSPGKPRFIKNRWMNKSNVVNYFRQEAQHKQANLFPTTRKPPITPMSRC